MSLLIRNADIIDPLGAHTGKGDLLMDNGAIAAVGKNLPAQGHDTLDADGLTLAPGFIDLHAHLRDPGYEYKETIETGLRAAAKGGFTSVLCMPNTDPPVDNASTVKYIRNKAAALNLGKLFVAGAISKGLKGQELAEMGEMVSQGVVAVTDDGRPVSDAQLMRRALEYSRIFGIPVMAHEEDLSLVGDGVMHEGLVSTIIGMKASPAAAEEVMVARDVVLAELTGAHLHLTHLSSRLSLDIALHARERGVNVTFDVTPHHLTLTDEAVMTFDTSTKVNPPLRPRAHVDALVQALAAGLITAIGTDHAPHAVHEKEDCFDDAPNGLIGFETAFAVLHTDLALTGAVPLEKIIHAMTVGPARILGLPQGRLKPGAPADLVLLDLAAEWTVNPDQFESLGRNCPYAGKKVRGRTMHAFTDGRPLIKDGTII
jgi:dihydroorotase